MEVLVEHDRLKNWEKLKGGEKRNKCEWVIVDENKENQPIIGRVMTKRTHIIDIICYDSSRKNEKQTGERSSNKVLQERLSNGVKRARTEKLIDISLWIKYTKGEMNLQLEPDYFVKREKGSSISSEQVKSLWSRKEEIRVVIEKPSLSKELEVILEKVKAHSRVKQNERADRIAKEGDEVDVPTRVKWVMTKGMIFWPVWKGIEIECSPREFIKQLLTTATRAEWTFNQGLYNEIHQKRIKKEEEILKSIKEELRQKDKIALGLDKLREVFIPRDIKEYKERHIEWSRGFLADKIGSSLERMNVSKNKAQNIAMAFLDE
ncbi:6647_t:CDS:2 [Gigaspora margarita]|uniref:6647_t:CDS:1 n=1 Tax=Gigaspora margarita TaxID=4874 RepID=A0ABN7VCZ8_GIGMA|nr:6647_t:CDS:2 [Gigaspora margarita]